MMKKLTALLLSLMMLVLPVMGSAASQTVVTFTPGRPEPVSGRVWEHL